MISAKKIEPIHAKGGDRIIWEGLKLNDRYEVDFFLNLDVDVQITPATYLQPEEAEVSIKSMELSDLMVFNQHGMEVLVSKAIEKQLTEEIKKKVRL